MIAMATSRVHQTPTSQPAPVPPRGRGHIGWIVAGSLVTGLAAALLLAFAPFVPAEERAVTGAVLLRGGAGGHGRRPHGIRAGLGDAGGALGEIPRPATAMGRRSCAVHGPG